MLKLFFEMYKYSNKEITYIFNSLSSIYLFTHERDQPCMHNSPAIIRGSQGLEIVFTQNINCELCFPETLNIEVSNNNISAVTFICTALMVTVTGHPK